jgi:hypothetical protein
VAAKVRWPGPAGMAVRSVDYNHYALSCGK